MGSVRLPCVGLSVGLGFLLACRPSVEPNPNPSLEDQRAGAVNSALSNRVDQIVQRERRFAESVWKPERHAQKLNRLIEHVWNQLNAIDGGLGWLAEQDFGDVELFNAAASAGSYPFGVEEFRGAERSGGLEWTRLLLRMMDQGWRVDFVEARQVRFEVDARTGSTRSRIDVHVALANDEAELRRFARGPLDVIWKPEPDRPFGVRVQSISTRGIEWRQRQGKPPFRLVLETSVAAPDNAHSIDPLLVRDLDHDGVSEIVLAGKNLVFRRGSDERYRAQPLCAFPPGLISTALLMDLDGDGAEDLLCAKHRGLVVLQGTVDGLFDRPEITLWEGDDTFKYPMVLSAGDYDQDGDLDVFLGQYRVPYEGGSLPTPFFNANDGHPFFVFRNDGGGQLTEVTESLGLTEKRRRRIYSASWVSLDARPGPDLVVVSDFAGVDLYSNQGGVAFEDVSERLLGQKEGFGMAHSFSDFNRDGRLDLLMIGMNSPTVDRLNHRGLWRDGMGGSPALRARMVQGNRLFLSGRHDGFKQNALGDSIARSGWAWGCTSADFDNDGYPDVFLANGLESRESVRDYESEYWLHDAFVADSDPTPEAYLYFKQKFATSRGRGHSYGGYEYDRLYLNRGGQRFDELGYLFGVGGQRDSRNVVSDDLNGDGRVDLVVTSFEGWPEPNQTLRVYFNELNPVGNWVGFRFLPEPDLPSPIGVRVLLQLKDHQLVDEMVTGDSYRSQHPASLHFGLGVASTVRAATIEWPDGRQLRLEGLPVNRSYRVSPKLGVIQDSEPSESAIEWGEFLERAKPR